jgi:hypothetical protein
MAEEKSEDILDFEQQVAVDEAEKQHDEVQRLLAKIGGSGYSAMLWRVSPKWAEGFLEEFDVDPDHGIDITAIAHKWGGQRIHIKLRNATGQIVGGTTLNLKSWKPKFLGKVMTEYEQYTADPEINVRSMPFGQRAQNNAPPSPPPAQADPTEMMKEVFLTMREMRKEDMGFKKGLLDGEASIPTDPIGQMMSGMRALKEMQELFGVGEAAIDIQPKNNDSELFPIISQVLGMMNNRPQAAAQPPPPQLNSSPKIRNDIAQPKQPNPMDLPGMLAGIPPKALSDILMAALSRMPPEQKDAIFAEIGSRLGDLDEVEPYNEELVKGEGDGEQNSDPNNPIDQN